MSPDEIREKSDEADIENEAERIRQYWEKQ